MRQASCNELGVEQGIIDIHVGQYSFVSIWSASGWDDTYLFAEDELFVVTLGLFRKRLAIFWCIDAKIPNSFSVAEPDGVTVEDGGDLSSMDGR